MESSLIYAVTGNDSDIVQFNRKFVGGWMRYKRIGTYNLNVNSILRFIYNTFNGPIINVNDSFYIAPEKYSGVVIYIYTESRRSHNIGIKYGVNSKLEDIKEIYRTLYPILKTNNKFNKKGVFPVQFIVSDMGGLDYVEREIKLEHPFDLKNYNEDFEECHKTIVEKLKNKEKGLYILHGAPGTGKSSYIKQLSSIITSRKFVYISSNNIEALASPGFINFALETMCNKVLIIEDAEKILLKREQHMDSTGVSNILNLTDGILADAMNLSVICTFNTDLENLDSALLRKGRLKMKYEFKELTADRCKEINSAVDSSMTLAELYNIESDSFVKEKTKIGF